MIEELVEALESDEMLRLAYRANIAMAFKDEYYRTRKVLNKRAMSMWNIHVIANQAAENFLTLLCSKPEKSE